MTSRTRIALLAALGVACGCDRVCGLLGPRWTPDALAGTYNEERSDGKTKAKLVVRSAATKDGTGDGNRIQGTFSAGDPRNSAEATTVRDIDPAELVDIAASGNVAGFDIDTDAPDICGKDTLINANAQSDDVGDLDGNGTKSSYRAKLRLLGASGSDTFDGELTVEVPRFGDQTTVSTKVAIVFQRAEGAAVRPLCRDESDDPGDAEDTPRHHGD